MEQELLKAGPNQTTCADQLASALAKIGDLEEIVCQKDATIQDLNVLLAFRFQKYYHLCVKLSLLFK